MSCFKADLLLQHLLKETEENHHCQDSKLPGRNFEVYAGLKRFRDADLLLVLVKGESHFYAHSVHSERRQIRFLELGKMRKETVMSCLKVLPC